MDQQFVKLRIQKSKGKCGVYWLGDAKELREGVLAPVGEQVLEHSHSSGQHQLRSPEMGLRSHSYNMKSFTRPDHH